MVQRNNLGKTKLSGTKIGVYFGQFAPMHKGHYSVVQQAMMENDGAVVVVSGHSGPEDRGMQINLPLGRRFRYIRETFNDEPTLRVAQLNEDNIPTYPNGWDVWTQMLMESVEGVLVDEPHEFTIYVGEAHYVDELTKRIPSNWKVKLVDRTEIKISATEIRNNPQELWKYILPAFKRNFTKKVLVVGSASTGKSTLVRRLANLVGATYSEEFARDYEEQYNVRDEELDDKDYAWFIQGQYDYNAKAIDDYNNVGITFLDTDAIVTRVYTKLYLPEALPILEPLFQETIRRQDFDLILVIPPITDYVDDGFRAMEWEDSRDDFHNELMAQLAEFGLTDKVAMLDANAEDGGFYARYEQAIQIIKDELNYDLLAG